MDNVMFSKLENAREAVNFAVSLCEDVDLLDLVFKILLSDSEE